jgi:hypothetical protein
VIVEVRKSKLSGKEIHADPDEVIVRYGDREFDKIYITHYEGTDTLRISQSQGRGLRITPTGNGQIHIEPDIK